MKELLGNLSPLQDDFFTDDDISLPDEERPLAKLEAEKVKFQVCSTINNLRFNVDFDLF
ncbi:MAG TPA: hypothetical protein VI754_05795 [Bacteriovoracaceae bacterium]|nr:hypothetical protein [Bacteriovoracaceae bacterium]